MNIETGEFRALTEAVASAYDSGQDTFAYEIGTEIRTMIDAGSTDTEILEVTRELVAARMEVGLPPGRWFQNAPGSNP